MAFAIETPHPVNHAGARWRVPARARRRSRTLSVISFLLWATAPLILGAFAATALPVPSMLLSFGIVALVAAFAAGSVTFGPGRYLHTLLGLPAGIGAAVVLFGLWTPPEYGWMYLSCPNGCVLARTLMFDMRTWEISMPWLVAAAVVAVASTGAYAVRERRA